MEMAKARSRTAGEWFDIHERVQRSGIGAKEYCESNGVKYQSYVSAISRMTKKPAGDNTTAHEGVQFVKAVIKPEPDSEEPPVFLQVEVGKFRINVPEGFNSTQLCDVCEALLVLC